MKLFIKKVCEEATLPQYAHPEDAGMDLYSIEAQTILPGETALVRTGIAIALPPNTEAQVRPRSGLAAKHSVTVLNTPGTIDSDYRGDVGVILINNGFEEFVVKQGDRIAQMVISKIEQVEFDIVKELNETKRGNSGFGHTGIN
jgi:dUTP pyrophosphatase